MGAKEFAEQILKAIEKGEIAPDAKVLFRHSVHQHGTIYSSADYILTAQVKDSLVICYDDGMF